METIVTIVIICILLNLIILDIYFINDILYKREAVKLFSAGGLNDLFTYRTDKF